MLNGRTMGRRPALVFCLFAGIFLAVGLLGHSQSRSELRVDVLAAAEPVVEGAAGWMAVDSNPTGLDVVVDGRLVGTTPMVLPWAEGSYQVTVGDTPPVAVGLESRQLLHLVVLVAGPVVPFAGDAAGLRWQLPDDGNRPVTALGPGTYVFGQGDGAFTIEPVFPRQRALDQRTAVGLWSLVASIGIAGVEVGASLDTPTDVPLVSAGAVLSSIAALISTLPLERSRRAYLDEFEPPVAPGPDPAPDLLALARAAEAEGDQSRSQEMIDRVLADHAESPSVTRALLQRARLYLLDGDLDGAESLLVRIIADEPRIPCLDEAGLLLIDLLLADDRVDEARTVYSALPRIHGSASTRELHDVGVELNMVPSVPVD